MTIAVKNGKVVNSFNAEIPSQEAVREIEAYLESLPTEEVMNSNFEFEEESISNFYSYFYPFLSTETPPDEAAEWVDFQYGFCKRLNNGNFLFTANN